MVATMKRGVAGMGVAAGLENGCSDAMAAVMQGGCTDRGGCRAVEWLQRCNGCNDAERLQGWDGDRAGGAATMQWLQ